MKGFTLLEVLVAAAVLAVAMVSLLGLHARNIRLIADTQTLTEAGLLAARLATTTKTGAFPPLGHSSGESGGDNGPGTSLSWTREVAETGLPGLHQVRINVSRQMAHADGGQAHLLADLVFLLKRGP